MLSSMTGFGRASLSSPFGKFTVEIQSINRKYLEIFIVMPKELTRLEPEVRKWVSKDSMRGQITVRIYFSPSTDCLKGLLPDSDVLRNLRLSWEKIAETAGFTSFQIDLPFVMLYLPVQPKPDLVEDKDLGVLEKCVEEALAELKKMRLKEGRALALDLDGRLNLLEEMANNIEVLAPNAAKRMREKLLERMQEFLKGVEAPDEKLFREVALFSEKIDITEELTRLKSHFVQFREILKSKGMSVGRKMDFLVQEIGREINTIGSKSLEAKISYLVVEMKSELEKMREQIQNIE